MTDWFSSLPDTAQAAALGALIAMVGVIVNNVVSAWNTGRQLQHDREQKEAERELALRREIYLGVAEHLHAALMMLGDLSDPAQPVKEAAANWRSSAHFNGQLHLMAGPALLRAVSAAHNAITEALLVLRPLRSRIDALQTEYSEHRRYIEIKRDEVNAALQELNRKQLEAPMSPDEVARILAVCERQQGFIEHLQQKNGPLLKQLTELRLDLVTRATLEQERVYPILVPVVNAARTELKQSFDADVYDDLLRTAAESAAKVRDRIEQVRTPQVQPTTLQGS